MKSKAFFAIVLLTASCGRVDSSPVEVFTKDAVESANSNDSKKTLGGKDAGETSGSKTTTPCPTPGGEPKYSANSNIAKQMSGESLKSDIDKVREAVLARNPGLKEAIVDPNNPPKEFLELKLQKAEAEVDRLKEEISRLQ